MDGGEGLTPRTPTSLEMLSHLLSRTTSRENANVLINSISLIGTYLPHLDLQLIN